MSRPSSFIVNIQRMLRHALAALVVLTVLGAAEEAAAWPRQPARWPAWWFSDSSKPNEFRVDLIPVSHPTVLPGGIIASKGPGLFFPDEGSLADFQRNGPDWRRAVHVLAFGRPLQALERVDASSPGGRVLDGKFGYGYVLWQQYVDDPHEIWRDVRRAYCVRRRSPELLRPRVSHPGPVDCDIHQGPRLAQGADTCGNL